MARPGLDELTQASWAGGICRAVARHLIPADAAYDIRDGLLDDDGNVYQRGPSARITTSQFGVGISAVWEDEFVTGRRVVVAGSGGVAALDAAGTGWFTLLASPPVAVAGGGLLGKLGNMALIPLVASGTPTLLAYGGARSVGATVGGATAVTVTKGSKIVTAAGALPGTILPGMFFAGSGGFTGVGLIKTVDSATQFTLETEWEFPTQVMTGYSWSSVWSYPSPSLGVAGASAVTVASNRVFVASGKQVLMSNTINQNTGSPRPWTFDADDYHDFPATVVALATLRDVVFVFTKAGVWTISNAALPIVDAFGNPQHRVQKVSGDVVLRSPGGLAPWRDSLVVCAVGGVYILDSAGGLELVSRSIGPLWAAHIAAGDLVWQAMTFRDHAFVPIGGEVLVGRLDRRTDTPVGKSAPWTRFSQGEAAVAAAMAVQDPYGTPRLIAGSPSVSGHLLNMSGVFSSGALPAATGSLLDGNAAPVGMVVETREYVVDAGALATVRDVALEYESTDGTLAVSAAVGQRATPTSTPTYSALASSAAGNYASQNPRVLGVRREARRISFQISSGGNVSGWRLRAVRLRSRVRGRRR